ncbi:hypothetical protein FAY30_13960 [Bacillus sp. S3]|uniref:hypothetical protein n=1 Tax=Bacillus sp. S3 TaxID=486398 RepID=UPI0011878F52|nr:hypothetical protein [Bacillus sp. S3]QCJ42929.1 hypothetical protein FAY30_13960 [Bacillus sp. S3]
MDAELVEKITRLVLSRLEEESKGFVQNGWSEQSFEVDERVEYPPLTNEEIKQWNNITSTVGFSKKVDEIPSHIVPLTMEELKTWKNLSVSMSPKEREHSRVKFSSYHE